ncbi:hypothetical protein BBP40_003348 [Aspergillus hancockii]|nr:hypothetical protein BBP40_003348 [Aspergillus hancockii]
MNFKSDLNILGPKDSIELTTITPVTRNFTCKGTMIYIINQYERNQYGGYWGTGFCQRPGQYI